MLFLKAFGYKVRKMLYNSRLLYYQYLLNLDYNSGYLCNSWQRLTVVIGFVLKGVLTQTAPHSYCSLVFSVCVLCVYEQNFWTTNNIGTLIELPKDMKLYKDQNKRCFF